MKSNLLLIASFFCATTTFVTASPRPLLPAAIATGFGLAGGSIIIAEESKRKTEICNGLQPDVCNGIESPYYCALKDNACVYVEGEEAEEKQIRRCAAHVDEASCVQLGSCHWDDDKCEPRTFFSSIGDDSDDEHEDKCDEIKDDKLESECKEARALDCQWNFETNQMIC
jgi:hypothetical protein